MPEGNEQQKYLTFMAVKPAHTDQPVTADAVNEFWTAAAKIITGLDGVVRVLPGQVLHAIFGFDEENQESQGMSACLSAQKLHDMARDFTLHIALHGDYVGGTRWSSDSLLDSSQAQKVVDLCHASKAGQTILSQSAFETVKTQAMTRSTRVMERGKGVVPVHILTRIIDRNNPLFYLRHTLNQALPLIGRENEFDTILSRADTAFQLESHHLHIEGEAGSGKTRLVYAAIDHLLEEHDDLTIFASPSGQSFSEGNPIQDFLRDVCKQAGLDFRSRDKIHDAFVELGLANDLYACAYLDAHNIKGASITWTDMALPDQQNFQAELAGRILAHLSRSCPVIVLFDDIHKSWSHAEVLVQALRNNFRDGRFFVLSISKKRDLFSPASARILKIESLSEQKIREIVRLALPDNHLHGKSGNDIVERANGNPYFALQLVRYIQKESQQQDTNDVMPVSLDTLFASQIQKMDEHLRDILGCCAVLGQKFLINHVMWVMDESPTAINAVLHKLEDQGLIRFSGAGVCEFTHDLAQECIYRALSADEKESLHRRILDILWHAKPGTICERPSRMAYHAFHARLFPLAYAFGYGAGLIDLSRSMPTQAEENLSLALVSLRQMTHDAKHDARLARTILNLSQALSLTGKPKDSLDVLDKIPPVSMGQNFNQQKILIETSIKWSLGDFTYEEIKEIETRINLTTRTGIGNGLRCAGMLSDQGYFEESNQRIYEIFPLVQKLDKNDNCGLLFPAASFCLSLLSRNYAELGKQYQAHECAMSALEEVEHLFAPKRVYALAYSAVHYQKQGLHKEALKLLKEAYFLTKEFQIGMTYPFVFCHYAYSLYLGTKDPTAFSIMRSGIDYAEQCGFHIRRGLFNFQYAEILDAAGRKAEAVRQGRLALDYARQYNERHIQKAAEAFLAARQVPYANLHSPDDGSLPAAMVSRASA